MAQDASLPHSTRLAIQRESKNPSSSERFDDLSVIRRARNNPADFAPIYDRYVDLIWRFAMSRLRDQDWAADVTSLTFSKAIAALPRFKPSGETGNVRAWLLMICRNVIIDERRKRRPVQLDPVEHESALIDTSLSPEESSLRQDTSHHVLAAIDQLPPRQRDLVLLRLQGLTGAEIAIAMSMSVAGVRTAQSRAYARLRDLLADHRKES